MQWQPCRNSMQIRNRCRHREKAYDFAKKRYDLNLLSTYDLISSQNNVQRARIQALYSQYDYVFKMKLLEFYKGQGLKL